MIRIGIIGSENSHAAAFSDLINQAGLFPGLRVVGIYGEDAAQSQKIYEKYGLEFVAEDARAMLGRIDALMVTSRNGALHAPYARPYLEAGLPCFIDKPFTNDASEALELLKLAEAHGAPVLGGSSVKYTAGVLALKGAADAFREKHTLLGGHAWAPVNLDNPYGGFYFYSAHLVENVLAIFGEDPLRVHAVRQEKSVQATLEYADFCVHLSFLAGSHLYGGVVLGDACEMRGIELDGCYEAELEHFSRMLTEGKSPQTARQLALPVFVLNAIERAYLSGETQEIGL